MNVLATNDGGRKEGLFVCESASSSESNFLALCECGTTSRDGAEGDKNIS